MSFYKSKKNKYYNPNFDKSFTKRKRGAHGISMFLKRLKTSSLQKTKGILLNRKRLSEFLKKNKYDYKLKNIDYKKHPVLKYLTDIFTLILKHSYKENSRIFQNAFAKSNHVNDIMRQDIYNEKKEFSIFAKKTSKLKSRGKTKYKFIRLFKKLRTNFGYRRFFNLFKLGKTYDFVDVPVKPLDVLDHYILKQTLRSIPTTFRKLKPFIRAVCYFQKMAYTLVDLDFKSFLLEKSSYRKYLNQWLAFIKNNPLMLKQLLSNRETALNKSSYMPFKQRTDALTDEKTISQSIFSTKFFKLLIIPTFATKYLTPGKKRYLRFRYERRLQDFVNYKYDLDSRFPINFKKLRRYAIKELTNVNTWARLLANSNLVTADSLFFKKYSEKTFPKQADKAFGDFLDSENSASNNFLVLFYKYKRYFNLVSRKIPMVTLLSDTRNQNFFKNKKIIIKQLNELFKKKKKSKKEDLLDIFPGKPIKAFVKRKIWAKRIVKKELTKIILKEREEEDILPYLIFLNVNKRVLSAKQLAKFQNLMHSAFSSNLDANVSKLNKLRFMVSLKNVIQQRKRYQRYDELRKKRYNQNKYRKSKAWSSNSKIPPFRIILRQSANNFFVTATVDHKRVINNCTSGLVGLKGPTRATSFAASQIGRAVGSTLKEMNVGPSLCIFKSPITRKLRAVAVGIHSKFKKIKAFLDLIPRSHNGLRLPKPRRL